MLLSDSDIKKNILQGEIRIEPYDLTLIQPASIDIRLDKYFRLFDNHRYSFIDPKVKQDDLTRLIEISPTDAFVLHPSQFVLASTIEKITIGKQLAARLEGKSSLGRLGLVTHSTAGFIDPGFSGNITLELSNVATLPILLYPGMRIGQLGFFQLSSKCEVAYGEANLKSNYQNQHGPTPSKAYRQF